MFIAVFNILVVIFICLLALFGAPLALMVCMVIGMVFGNIIGYLLFGDSV